MIDSSTFWLITLWSCYMSIRQFLHKSNFYKGTEDILIVVVWIANCGIAEAICLNMQCIFIKRFLNETYIYNRGANQTLSQCYLASLHPHRCHSTLSLIKPLLMSSLLTLWTGKVSFSLNVSRLSLCISWSVNFFLELRVPAINRAIFRTVFVFASFSQAS